MIRLAGMATTFHASAGSRVLRPAPKPAGAGTRVPPPTPRSTAERHEVLVHAQPVRTAFLRVKLRTHHVGPRGRRGRRVLAPPDRGCGLLGRERVDEVEVRPILDPLPQHRVVALRDATPADHWKPLTSCDLDHTARQQSETLV